MWFAAAPLTSSPLPHQSGVPGAQGQPPVANKIVAWTGVLEWQEVKLMYGTVSEGFSASPRPVCTTETQIKQR